MGYVRCCLDDEWEIASAEPNQNRTTARSVRGNRLTVSPVTPQKDHHSFACTQKPFPISMLARLVSNLPRRAVPSARRAISVQVPTSSRARSRALTVSAVRAQSILHGSQEAKEAGDNEIQQHSRIVARGKYLHGIESTSHAYKGRATPFPQSYCSQFIGSSRKVSRSIRKPRRSIYCVL
jgi:hypothetical protein